MTEITQADRDAAASGYFAWCSGNPVIPDRMKAGNADDHSMVQAFARHRKYGYDQGYYDGRQFDRMEERAAIVAMIWGDVLSDYISEYHADILRDLIDRIEGGEHLK